MVEKVTVPELLLNVPLLVKLVSIVMLAGEVSVPLELIVRLPLIFKVKLFDAPVTVTAFVPFPIETLLETFIVCPVAVPRVKVGPVATLGAKLKL